MFKISNIFISFTTSDFVIALFPTVINKESEIPELAFSIRKNESKIIVLIKPQFEAIRSQVEAGGIISNPYIHAEVLNNLLIEYKKLGLSFIEVKKSRVLGRKGNQEFFCVLKIL